MHPGDHNAALGFHDCGDRFRAAEQRFSGTSCSHENWILVFYRGRKNNDLGRVRVLRQMLFVKSKAKSLKSIGLCGRNFVRAANRVPQFDQETRKSAHTTSRNTDKVNSMLFGG